MPIKQVVLAGSPLTMEWADVLLELFWAQKAATKSGEAENEFVTYQELQRSLMNSQPHISRTVKELAEKKWVKPDRVTNVQERSQHHANSFWVRITDLGLKTMQPVWSAYLKLAQNLFEGISTTKRRIHLQVNEEIRRSLHPFSGSSLCLQEAPHAVENIISLLKARRELAEPIRTEVLAESDLTLEQADLLTDLYGARDLGWPDPLADAEGFVTLGRLQASLVHSQTLTQILLSRRIRKMKDLGWVEVRSTKEDKKYLSEKDGVRITDLGVDKIRPVWQKYNKLAEGLLARVSLRDQQVHREVNEALIDRIRPAWVRGSRGSA